MSLKHFALIAAAIGLFAPPAAALTPPLTADAVARQPKQTTGRDIRANLAGTVFGEDLRVPDAQTCIDVGLRPYAIDIGLGRTSIRCAPGGPKPIEDLNGESSEPTLN